MMKSPEPSVGYRNKIAISLTVVVLFLAATITLSLYGKTQRVYAPGVTAITVESTEEAFSVWEERKVKGRTLLLFGNYPHITRSSDYKGVRQLGPSNLIEFAAFSNIVRRIYYLIPDADWEGLIRQGGFGAFRKVPGMERGLYLYNLVGIPIIATTPTSLPHLSEISLVYINSQRFNEADVRDILSSKGIASDIIILHRGS
jgi:hypothetical protein